MSDTRFILATSEAVEAPISWRSRAGRIVHREPDTSLVVVASDDGFTLVELLGDEQAVSVENKKPIGVEEEVECDWTVIGGASLITAGGIKVEAYVRGTWGTMVDAMAALRAP